jgi:hypothetical protein
MSERCFVIQPFDDGGPFDKRYDDVLVPAIRAAELEEYRVDRDPNVAIPIDQIETAIPTSVICLADITLDNPNVWFELGYAIALAKQVVLICNKNRATPFSIRCATPHDHSIRQRVVPGLCGAARENYRAVEGASRKGSRKETSRCNLTRVADTRSRTCGSCGPPSRHGKRWRSL